MLARPSSARPRDIGGPLARFAWALAALTLVACEPPVEPDPEPHDTVALAGQLADEAAARWPADVLSFDWQQTVLSYGFHRLHAASGDVARTIPR